MSSTAFAERLGRSSSLLRGLNQGLSRRFYNEAGQKMISHLTTFLLLAITAWVLGQLVWLLMPRSESIATWTPSATAVTTNKTASTLDLSSLQTLNVFGEYKPTAKKVVAAPVVNDAPKTRLNLTLNGLVASSNSANSLAIIGNRNKQGTYGLGEVIEGTRVKLKAVFVDRVILDNGGRDETLMLDGAEYKKMSDQTQRRPSANNSQDISTEKLAKIKQELTTNPQSIFQYVRLSQVKRDNKIVGYRVSPGRDSQLFKSVGLQSGDIAVQINGADLTDPIAMATIFKSINELTELNLTVERDGQQHEVYIEF